MLAQFVHQIDPVITQIGNVYLWWYGLSYTLGFLGVYFWLRRNRERLCLTPLEAYDATILLTAGVLVGVLATVAILIIRMLLTTNGR